MVYKPHRLIGIINHSYGNYKPDLLSFFRPHILDLYPGLASAAAVLTAHLRRDISVQEPLWIPQHPKMQGRPGPERNCLGEAPDPTTEMNLFPWKKTWENDMKQHQFLNDLTGDVW